MERGKEKETMMPDENINTPEEFIDDPDAIDDDDPGPDNSEVEDNDE